MRLFVGIPLADAAVGELSALVSRLRKSEQAAATQLRWTDAGSWHITLQFLGNATAEQLECLTARLGEIRAATVAVQIGELGVFDRTGVFFADVVVASGLGRLQRAVVAATSQCGFVAETRPFHPHITLARTKGHGRVKELQNLREKLSSAPSFTPFTANEFLIYESHLGAEGSRYEVRARFHLGT